MVRPETQEELSMLILQPLSFPSPAHINLQLIWEENPQVPDLEIDLSAFLLVDNRKLKGGQYFVFYNQLASPCNSVLLSELTNLPGGVLMRSLSMDLSRLSAGIEEVLIVSTLSDVRMAFGNVGEAQVSVEETATGKALFRFDLKGDFRTANGVELVSIQKKGEAWEILPRGIPLSGGLSQIVASFSN